MGLTRYGGNSTVVDVLVRVATSAGHRVRNEVHLDDSPDIVGARPGDVSFSSHLVNVDVVAFNRVATAGIRKRGCFAAARAATAASSSGHTANVVAFTVSTCGNVDSLGHSFLAKDARDFVRKRQIRPAWALTVASQVVSLTVYRGVAHAILLRYAAGYATFTSGGLRWLPHVTLALGASVPSASADHTRAAKFRS
ncbi:hypothetical protein FVE85_3733 [Porphyridium purpureum]|uniref:Uncharacterized protein n=1 Tax=Porphyridium purpureum TaxID=35688 RepID=A0A5J4YMC0_PORPP|nr:hypothetical protein FVE85_3733 [Porphyridium purpureum]|eukprot:POR9737..scf249_10